MSKYHHLYYISGSQDPSITKPGENYHLKLTKEGIKLYASKLWGNTDFKIKKDLIKWENVIGVEVSHSVKSAVTLASLIGGTDKVVDSMLVIRYKQNSGKVAELMLSPMIRGSRVIEKAKTAIAKRVAKNK